MTLLWMGGLCLLGMLVGIVTGLLPGVHVNVTAAFLAASAASLTAMGVPPLAVAGFIVALSVTHTLFDIIPTVFLGIPADESYALLPSQRLVMRGQGLEAVYHAIHGSWGGLLGAAVLIGAALALGGATKTLEEGLAPWMGYLLLVVSVALVAFDRRRGWALAIFLSSGLFGLIVFATPLVAQEGAFNVLFPALGGLFGVSGLVLALLTRDADLPPQQGGTRPRADVRAIAAGTVGGLVSGLLPGLGSANVATAFALRGGDGGYLQTVAAINATDHLMSIAALVLIGRARSGAAGAIEEALKAGGGALTPLGLAVLCVVALVTGLACRGALLRTAPTLAERVCALPQRALGWAVLGFVVFLVGLTTGPWGFAVLVPATALGMVAPLVGTRRAHAMGMFLVPVTLQYLGLQADVVSALRLGQITVPHPPQSPLLALAALLGALAVAALLFQGTCGRWRRGLAMGAPIAAAAIGLWCLPTPSVEGGHVSASVVRVKDGDTLRVRTGGQELDVRLVDIDCPEKTQPYGMEARARVKELVGDGPITLTMVDHDKYGRTLGRVELADGRVLNRLLVEEGWAWRYDRYCQDPELLRLQEAARAARRGLWADPSPTPPWDYRKATRQPVH